MKRRFVVAGMIFEVDERELVPDIVFYTQGHEETWNPLGILAPKYGYFSIPWRTVGPRESG